MEEVWNVLEGVLWWPVLDAFIEGTYLELYVKVVFVLLRKTRSGVKTI